MEAISQAASAVREANYLLVLAGAGMSADSGLSVFKQLNDSDTMKQLGMTYDQIASLDGFCRDNPHFLGFWTSALQNYQKAQPHEGYVALKSLVDSIMQSDAENSSWVCTTNVDGMFLRLGLQTTPTHTATTAATTEFSFFIVHSFDASKTNEIHGSIWRWQCGGKPNMTSRFPLFVQNRCCDQLFPAPTECSTASVNQNLIADIPSPPCVHGCGGLARPNIYLFGDGSHFVADPEVTREKAFSEWQEYVKRSCSNNSSKKCVVIEIGCGLRVPSLRRRGEAFAMSIPKDQCTYIRINPEYFSVDAKVGSSVSIQGGAKDTLVALLNACSEQAITTASESL